MYTFPLENVYIFDLAKKNYDEKTWPEIKTTKPLEKWRRINNIYGKRHQLRNRLSVRAIELKAKDNTKDNRFSQYYFSDYYLCRGNRGCKGICSDKCGGVYG